MKFKIKFITTFSPQARNAYGVTTGSYQYIDANGLLQTVNYIADPVNGFRVAGTNLPVAGAAPAVEPLVAPVFDLPLPVAVEDTAEVAAAKAEFAAAYDAAAAAAAAAPEEAAERKRRDADEVAAPAVAALPAVLPYPYAGAYGVGAGLFGGVYAAAPGAIVANIAHAAPTVAALPAAAYAAAPAIAAPAIAATYAAAPLAAAAPSREAVLTTVKLNPGHAISYRVD